MIAINDNVPFFTPAEVMLAKQGHFEYYGELDDLGRCTVAFDCLGKETMPNGQKRGSISAIRPTGWKQARYDCVDSETVMTRAHLAGYMLSTENANVNNLITGTRYMNADAMLPYEESTADYLDHHPTIAPAKDFHLTEADWQTFRQRVIDSGFTYDPVSQKQFSELVKTAKFEGYYDDAREAFDALEKKLKHNVASDLDKHRAIIQQTLELDIIAAYYYQKGSLEAGLDYDNQLKEAERILNNPDEYQRILQPAKQKN